MVTPFMKWFINRRVKMFARVSTIQGKSNQIDDGIRDYKEHVIPAIKNLTGFKQAFLMVDRKIGKTVSITFWETEQNIQASTSAADKVRAQGAKAVGAIQSPVVEIFEVAVAEVPMAVSVK
jgi:heme-degrading monooxygenase HmoA